ncbi:MAG TPA: hypothetical protein PKW90_19460, partial [Myxococcota bacterium]|nr:hypothetical protein [Myxococcota bacterium]
MPDPTLRPQAPALWAGRYRLGTCIGRGSSGKVFAAEDVREGRQVAVKILQPLDPVERGRLQREIAALSFLQLPGVVRLLDHGQVGAQV